MSNAERIAAAHADTRTCNAGPTQPRHCHSLACRSKMLGILRFVRCGGG